MKAIVYLDPDRKVIAVTVDGVKVEFSVEDIDGEPDLELAIQQEQDGLPKQPA